MNYDVLDCDFIIQVEGTTIYSIPMYDHLQDLQIEKKIDKFPDAGKF
jgi:hypothetical protein